MEFGLSEIQTALQENLHRFLNERVPLDRVREFASSEDLIAHDVWSGLAELGLTGALVPETLGGSGLGFLDAVVINECLGSHVTPSPFIATCVVAATAVSRGGTDSQQTQYLGDIASGQITFGLALSEVSAARQQKGVVHRDGSLHGTALFVTDPGADFFLVADQEQGLHIVDATASGLEVTSLPIVDRTRPVCELKLDGVAADTLSLGGDGLCRFLIDVARVMYAADTLGASQAMLDQAIAYALQREQFNRVIASFQAVKHMCAEMAAEIEPSRSLVWYAGHALDDASEDARLTACHAKAHLSEVGTFVARTATVVHGGMGFTDLLGLHYWFKRIGYNRQMLGGPEFVREEAAREQGLVE